MYQNIFDSHAHYDANAFRIDREEVLGRFHELFMARYAQLERGEKEAIQHDYRLRMYRLGERHPYRLPDGTLFEATIEGVRPSGALLLRRTDGSLGEYLFREVEFVIAAKA